MRERDEEGRPIATRNAGAFLAPYTGVVPVPSSLVESPSGDDTDQIAVERRGPHSEANAANATTPLSERGRRAAAIASAVAVWVLLATGFRLVLLATEPWADIHPVVIGDRVTVLMHAGWFWWLANIGFLALGIWLSLGRARSDGRWRLASIAAGTAACAAAVLIAVDVFGGTAAAFAAGGAVVWLLMARWLPH